MGKGKDRNAGSPKRSVESPKSPSKGKGGGGGSSSSGNGSWFKREVLKREIPPINVTPYPLSTSTEMAMAMSSEAQALQEHVKVLSKSIIELQATRDKNETTLNSINTLSDKIVAEEKITTNNRNRLKRDYEQALGEVGEELQLVHRALNTVYQIRAIRHDLRIQAKSSGNKETFRRGALMKMLLNCAQTLPVWLGGPADKPPPLSGSVPPESNYIVKVGDMAACLVRGSEGEENWILAEISGFNPSTGRYEVEDIDEEQKERHTLSRRRVYPLPLRRANPETNPEALYPEGTIVMALYPQTTCFYKAYVSQPPTLACDDYEVLFEDSSYVDGYSPPLRIAQRYVLPYKDPNKKK
ncbi:SAGA-associated factor 29 [Hyalella azteca]|uniref:SAGA-associated factor 29 n=1 Tax=Hyalella azteca TaxID=294128 RepID=A0A8B7N2L0_HYAAZ|nr:SAGA-associated factor 29 [Hyalella azteca]